MKSMHQKQRQQNKELTKPRFVFFFKKINKVDKPLAKASKYTKHISKHNHNNISKPIVTNKRNEEQHKQFH